MLQVVPRAKAKRIAKNHTNGKLPAVGKTIEIADHSRNHECKIQRSGAVCSLWHTYPHQCSDFGRQIKIRRNLAF